MRRRDHLIRRALHVADDVVDFLQQGIDRGQQAVPVLHDFPQQIADGQKLVGHAARIALIGQDQIQHGGRLQNRQIATAIGDDRVAQLQRQPQPDLHSPRLGHGMRLVQHMCQFGGDRPRPFHPAAEIQEQPTTAAHHVFRREASNRGGELQHLGGQMRGMFQRLRVAVRRKLAHRLSQFAQGPGQNGMHFAGQTIPKLIDLPGDQTEQFPHATAVAEGAHDGGGKHGRADDAGLFLRHHARGSQTGGQQLHFRQFTRRRRWAQDAGDDRALQPRRPLQPLQIPAQPEEIIRHPARQVASGAPYRQSRGGKAQGALDRGGFLGQDPDVFRHRIARQATGERVFLGQGPRQSARQGPPAAAVENQEHAQGHRFRFQPVRTGARRDRRVGRHRRGIAGRVGGHSSGQFLPLRHR